MPEKNALADYATQKNVKEDARLIEKRKRMLASFLNRIMVHPVLSRDHIVHLFLEGGTPWSGIIHGSLYAPLLKQKDDGDVIIDKDAIKIPGTVLPLLSHLISFISRFTFPSSSRIHIKIHRTHHLYPQNTLPNLKKNE